jgi:hypothetical protein
MIAALFVQRGGCYYGLEGVDPWDEERDARSYPGPYPVVAHPPCERWGRFARGLGLNHGKFVLGDDNGCFESALASVRKWGGVLEHPEGSAAWKHFGLHRPYHDGSWTPADWLDGHRGWTCCVEQGAYGHKARKRTWLYAHGVDVASLRWGRTKGEFGYIGGMGFHSSEERARWKANPDSVPWAAERKRLLEKYPISHSERAATPLEFRDILIEMARSVTNRIAA